MIKMNFISIKMQKLHTQFSVGIFRPALNPYLAEFSLQWKTELLFIQVNSINNVDSPSASKHYIFPACHVPWRGTLAETDIFSRLSEEF